MNRPFLSARLAGCVILALAMAPPAVAHASRASRMPHSRAPYYHGDQDGPLSMAQSPNGALWSVWSYRQAGGFDIAISRSVGRTWTSPVLLGGADGWDDRDPQIAFLADGTALITWWRQRPDHHSQVMISLQREEGWTPPRPISDPDLHGRQPRLYSEDGEISVGFITEDPRTGDAGFSLIPVTPTRPQGGTNGPDPIPTITISPGDGSGNQKPPQKTDAGS